MNVLRERSVDYSYHNPNENFVGDYRFKDACKDNHNDILLTKILIDSKT